MAIYRPLVSSSSLSKSPVILRGVLLILAVLIAVIYFPIFLYGLTVNTENWKELSSPAFFKAIVAPSALSAFATFSLGCGTFYLYCYSESCTARLYENFGRAHLICQLQTASLAYIRKACLVYIAGAVAAFAMLRQYSEGVKDIVDQNWPSCTQASDDCVMVEAYRFGAIIMAGQAVLCLSAVSLGTVIRFTEFWVLYTLTQKCVKKQQANAECPIQYECQGMKDTLVTTV